MPDNRKPGRSYGSWGSDPSLSPDGRKIAFISDRNKPFAYDVCLADADGTHLRTLGITKVARYNRQPRFTPDGKSILFLAGTQTNRGSRAIFSLWRVDVDGRNAREVADSGLFTNPEKWKHRD
jgi:Tol biopolymer transport system component